MKNFILFTMVIFAFAATSEAKSIFTFNHDIKVKTVRINKQLPTNSLNLFRPLPELKLASLK